MEKINFQDLPSTNTPIDSNNLNLLQNNIEEAIEEKQSLPIGGTTGQVLGKNSDADYDVAWINQTGGGSGTGMGGDTIPIGSVMPFAKVDSNSPLMSDWLLCDGRAVSRTIYSELFSTIGTTYGAGDGNTTFNLPDVKGRVIVGQDEADDSFKTLGAKIGEKEVTLTIAQMPRHNHDLVFYTGSNGGFQSATGVAPTTTVNRTTSFSGNGEAHNNIQPSLVLKYYIKTFRSASLTADVKNAKTTSTKDTYSCDYINNLTDNFTGFLLWTNPNPNAVIDTMQITLDDTQYDTYAIIWKQTITSNRCFNTGQIPKGYGTIMIIPDNHYRTIEATNNGLSISSAVNEPRYCIPLYIVGYKNNLFN